MREFMEEYGEATIYAIFGIMVLTCLRFCINAF